MMLLNYTVPGRPKPWDRTRGSGKRRPNATKYANYKKRIAHIVRVEMLRRRMEINTKDELRMVVHSYYPDRKFGDVDNLAKGHMDALEKVLYKNDKQVCSLLTERFVDKENPRVEVEVYRA